MKQFLRDYFLFNRRERNGILFLVFLLSIVSCLSGYLQTSTLSDPQKAAWKVLTFDSHSDTGYAASYSSHTVYPESKQLRQQIRYFYFNPNTIGAKEWMLLGLSEKQTRIVIHYCEKGGRFRKPGDLKKLYGLSPAQDSLLEPWVKIPEDTFNANKNRPDTLYAHKAFNLKLKPGEVLDLNKTDSAGLLKVPCIGPAFASRIIQYRNRLGGFAWKEQLQEVFGMDEARYQCMESYILLETKELSTIKINTASLDELKKHPYIRWNMARAIVNYRARHGRYKSIEDVKAIELADEDLIRRIKPYLSFE
ncbi:MAG: helix-hairpin-helix domain-containing protein [Bacteroidia bacterium]